MILGIIVVLCLCFNSIGCTFANSIETDKEALLSFKSQITIPSSNSNPLSSWDQHQTSSPCNWTGVVCNSLVPPRVISLNLSNSALTGTITPHIGNLSFLRSLHLQNNQLQGPIPPQISNLFRLRLLNLSSNSLSGPIPPNITDLANLRSLDLMMNKITGTIPENLSSLTNLQVLNLARNALLGRIPPSIGNLSSLNVLNLGTNSLTGIIPEDLSRLRNLRILDLTINHLTGTIPPSIYNMSSLTSLALASNWLWGRIPENVGDTLPNLLVFNFCFNNFTGPIPGSLHNLTNIQVIRMAYNLLEGTVPPGLQNLPYLTMYNIGYNRIVNSRGDDVNGLGFLTSLANSTRLNFLALDGNLFRGTIPDSVGNLSKVLSKLYMGGNRIYGRIPSSIGLLKGLTLLDLSNSQINGSIPQEIGQLEDLQALVLGGNKILGQIPDSLGNLRKLNRIDLSGNELVGGIPTSFGNFQNLLSMDLSNNKLDGRIPNQILDLPSLSTTLNLSHNFLSGPLSSEIRLENLVTIDLSANNLSGNIPTSIQNCLSLEKLYMSNNTLSGPIPSSIGKLKGLETIDLSYNKLSGLIPVELQELNALQSLNLSFNNLEGAVPNAGLFSNLSKVHLEGNPKLCLDFIPCKNTGKRGVKFYVVISITPMFAFFFLVASVLIYVKKIRGKKTLDGGVMMKNQHKMVSYNQLRQATANFSEDNLIGKGSFGSVYKGLLNLNCDNDIEAANPQPVAIKSLDVQVNGSRKSFLAECEALRNVRHRNLVKLITSCSSWDAKNKEFLALVYEFLGNGSLEDWLSGKRRKENGNGLNFVERLNAAIDVAGALDYLHHDCQVPVVHCDLKPSNILLDENMNAKVGDFGLATLLIRDKMDQPSSTTRFLKGSIGYIPPEYGVGLKASTAGDVYSYGVMLLEMFTGKRPTHESFNGEQNLVGWVQSLFPDKLQNVLHPQLLLLFNHMGDDDDDDDDLELDGIDCFITVLGVGLSCTATASDRRITIRDALQKLTAVRSNFLNPTPTKNIKHSTSDLRVSQDK